MSTPTSETNPLRRRAGCPDLDPNWPDIFGNPRGPRVCTLYPNCECGNEDRVMSNSENAQLPSNLSNELLPCPFCSSTKVVLMLGERDHVDYVVCNDCHTEGPFAHSPEAAVTKWNKRPAHETLAALRVYTHVKTGNQYEVLHDATETTNGSREGRGVVVYRRIGQTAVYVREATEFHEKFVSSGERNAQKAGAGE